MNLLDLADLLFRTFPALRRQKWIRSLVTRFAVREATKAVPPRPHPFCMRPEYTTWRGLTDRRITGRHLGCAVEDQYRLPDVERLAELFLRPPGTEKLCSKSSLLFAAFAQWFTDSFLRTSHGFIWETDGNARRDKDDRLVREQGREAFNDSNHEIDLCQIYGVDEDRTTLLRMDNPGPEHRGFLAYEMHGDEMYPRRLVEAAVPKRTELKIVSQYTKLHDERLLRVIFDKVPDARITDLFAVGLEHGNVTLGNSLFNTIFLREHNRVATVIGTAQPEWTDEQVFQTTRNVLIVMLLRIVLADYIPHLSPRNLPFDIVTGFPGRKPWYRANRISIEFNLLYRWHELIPDRFEFLDELGDYQHNNGWLLEHGPEALVEALSRQRSTQLTLGNTPMWLRSVLEDTLQMMRDSRLASYSAYRERFGMKKPSSFADVTSDPVRRKALEEAYPDGVDSLEWYVGMYAEDIDKGTVTGDLMRAMVAYDAFTHALTNPLLADGVYVKQTLTEAGLAEVEKSHRLCDLIRRNVKNKDLCCSLSVPAAA